jgi:protein TonB
MKRARTLAVGIWLSMLAFSQPRQISVTEAELRAAATQRVEPEYPAVARQTRLTGDVDLEIIVDENGAVDKVNLIRGNALLAGPSVQAIRKWKFKPFQSEGQPARARGPIRFTFQM